MRIDIIQHVFIDAKLRNLTFWLELETGLEFTETSTYRIGDPGVHGTLPVRGIDLRCRNRKIGEAIAKLINSYWEYDKKRPEKQCALYHGKAPHLHLQVHPNTRRRWSPK